MTTTIEESATTFLSSTDQAYAECANGISNLDKIIVSVSSRFSGMTRGYLLPIIYAYWERFFRTVFAEYLRCVELMRADLNAIHPNLAQFRLRRELNEILKRHSIKQLQEISSTLDIEQAKAFCENLADFFKLPIVFADSTNWIETESNVNFTVLESNCKNFGIDIESIKNRLAESKITLYSALKQLVDVRNQISHGETFKDIDQDEWETLKNFTLTVMTTVQLELFETLRNGRCLKIDPSA
ncbi:MAG: hypothetical protein EPN22_06290 [Nitrospirae bacterium]|nr:MAG: hypothetical protein EPN22_06290 [Nitrospirota bacterium]